MLKIPIRKNSGFTLLELVIVIALISIIMSIIIILIDPTSKINAAYEAAKATDSQTIRKAVNQYYIDNLNYDSLNITNDLTEICDTQFNSAEEVVASEINCTGLIDLSKLVPIYVVGIPTNPTKPEKLGANNSASKNINGAGYQIQLVNGEVEVHAIDFQIKTKTIQIVRGFNFNDINSSIIALSFIIILIVGFATYWIIKSRSRNNI